MGDQPLERRRAGRRGRRQDALRQLPRPHLRRRPGQRQDALALRVVPSTSSCPRCRTIRPMLDASRFAIVAAEEYVWSLARDVKDQNYFAPFRLTCRRADNGEVVWKSADLPDYAALRPGRPADPGRRQAVHRGQEPTPIRSNGRASRSSSSWRSSRTTASCSGRPRSGCSDKVSNTTTTGRRSIAPAAAGLPVAGAIYVDTHIGVLARLDADSGVLDWGYGYQTDPFQSGYRLLLLPAPGAAPAAASPPLATGDAFSDQGEQVRAPLRDRSGPA